MPSSVDPEQMRSAARSIKGFQEIFSANLSVYEQLAYSHLGAFGNDEPGMQMFTEYEQMAKPLWANSGSFGDAVARVGDTASHSANAWESTGLGFKGGPPPIEHNVPNPGGGPEAPHNGPPVK